MNARTTALVLTVISATLFPLVYASMQYVGDEVTSVSEFLILTIPFGITLAVAYALGRLLADR